jgi:hypothetical protein
MSLNASTLGALFKTAFTNNGAADNAVTTALANALASAVVSHITSSAVVVPTLLVAPGGGGPVTGTGTIT